MRCKRCGTEVEDGLDDCPNCFSPSGKHPIVKLDREEKELPVIQVTEPKIVAAQTSSSLRKTGGSLKAIGSGPLKKPETEPLWRSFLLRDVSLRIFLFCIFGLIALLGLSVTGLYIYRRFKLDIKLPDQVIKEYPTTRALKIVREFPSTTKGLSVEQRVGQFVKEQNLTSYHWWAVPDKTSGKYAVLFIFTKDKKEQAAVWLVDLDKSRLKADNQLAVSFSGL